MKTTPKPLRFWNGRVYNILSTGLWRKYRHVFVAAYSRADARRLCVEVGLTDPGESEIRVFWSETWGITMDDQPRERGVWLERSDRSVVRVVKGQRL